MTRRLIAALLLVLSAALPVRAADTVELELWQGFKFSETELLRENIEEFCAEWNATRTPRIRIKVSTVPFSDMVRKVRSAALARRMPDMAFVDANGMVPLVFGGVVKALDSIEGFPEGGIEALRAEYVPGAFDTNLVTLKGRQGLYGLPAQTTTLALFYNKEHFRRREAELRRAGLDPEQAPRDWNELILYARVLADERANITGFAFNNSLWFTMPFLNQYGAEIVTRDEEDMLQPSFSTDRARAALARKVNLFLTDKVEAGAWREGAMDPDQGFLNERYSMILTGPWNIEKFRESGLDFGVALIPRVPVEEARALGLISEAEAEANAFPDTLSAGNIGGQNLVVFETCAHPEIALQFALHYSGEKVQREWAERLGQIPVNRAAQENLNLDKFPEVPLFIRQINLARPLPALPFGNVLETEIFNAEVSLVLQGTQTVEQALQRADAALARRILAPVNEAERAWQAEAAAAE